MVDVATDIGQEYFLLIAGSYKDAAGPGGFGGGMGNWQEVNRKKFPSGLKLLADHVRSKGLKFGLWLKPGRVAKGSLLAKQHPGWVLWLPVNLCPRAYQVDPDYGLLNYSVPKAQEWLRDMLDDFSSTCRV